jgi:hypothetical protein
MRHADNTLQHGYFTANEDAIDLLEAMGMVTEVEPEVWRWVEPEKSAAEILALLNSN